MSNGDWSDRELDDGGRGERAVDREIERLKAVYRQHADALAALASSAPTKALARKYSELIGDINRSILGLDDPGALARRSTSERPLPPPEPAVAATPPPASKSPRSVSNIPLRTAPGVYAADAVSEKSAIGRIALILGLAIILICVLAFFVWRFGGEPRTEPEPAVEVTSPEPSAASAPLPGLRVSPEAQDYGVVYKGTRVAKSFEIANTRDSDLTIEIERSECRCLWFDHPQVVSAGGTVQLTIAVDGDLAPPGLLSEAVVISTKEPPRQATEVQITAQIR
jgi:hypothetical protein